MKTWEGGDWNGGQGWSEDRSGIRGEARSSSKWVTVGVLGLGLAVGAWLLDLGLVSGGIGTIAPSTTTIAPTTTTTISPAIVAGPAPSSNEISPVPPVPASTPSTPAPAAAISPALSPASSPGCPASGVITEHHTTYDALGHVKTDQWQNIFCGLSEQGWCWAPPVLTWPGEPTQTGVDATREVCA